MASPHVETTPEINVLVVGMPNVGKSTLLNALRNFGIAGRMFIAIFIVLAPGQYFVLSCSNA
jgi:mitochondrial GTPase 1